MIQDEIEDGYRRKPIGYADEVGDSINRFIVEIREFSKLNDDQMRTLENSLEAQRKTFKEIKKMIKDINPIEGYCHDRRIS